MNAFMTGATADGISCEENVRQCEGNFVALSMLADTPAGTDLSGWSHEQVAWALAGAGGAFAQEAA